MRSAPWLIADHIGQGAFLDGVAPLLTAVCFGSAARWLAARYRSRTRVSVAAGGPGSTTASRCPVRTRLPRWVRAHAMSTCPSATPRGRRIRQSTHQSPNPRTKAPARRRIFVASGPGQSIPIPATPEPTVEGLNRRHPETHHRGPRPPRPGTTKARILVGSGPSSVSCAGGDSNPHERKFTRT